MDFRLTPEQEAFRAEVRAWLSANLPPDWAARPVVSEVPRSELYDFGRHWQRKLHEAGLLGLTWPKEYGGRGLTWMEELLLHEELVLHRAPPPLNVLGLGMAGPTIIAYGTEAQKARYVQKILTCEEI
jgi:alkylation response protein AidB-like acyl-CoA dehydrogenase